MEKFLETKQGWNVKVIPKKKVFIMLKLVRLLKDYKVL